MNKKANNFEITNQISFWGDSLTKGRPGASFFEVLKSRLLEYELLNYGKGGDTVISLYRRIKEMHLNSTCDIAFLWVGTNDVFEKISWSHTILKALTKQPRAKNPEEFERYYRLLLDNLCQQANRVITVPLLFMGEDINNQWNQEMEELSRIIEQVSDSYNNVEYLDLRKIVLPKLEGKTISSYLPKSVGRIALDTLSLKHNEQIDRMSTERGLFYTLDGVHLNSVGAELVAEAFLETIKKVEGRISIPTELRLKEHNK
jgi:lysophospholipase L1-like esterase